MSSFFPTFPQLIPPPKFTHLLLGQEPTLFAIQHVSARDVLKDGAMSATFSSFRAVVFGTLFLVISLSSYAQRVTAAVDVGNAPNAVAVNQATNRIYVSNLNSNNVTVIDGSNNSTAVVNVGTGPRAIAANPITNKIYVANGASATVTVIDGSTNTTTPVNVGTTPAAIAVNPITNKIYVANLAGNSVTVIDGLTNATATVGPLTSPRSIAVNPVTNKIYVTSQTTNNVTVIDGTTNTPTPVNVSATSFAVAVNPVTNKIYVTNPGGGLGGGTVTVIDGSNNNPTPVATATTTPIDLAVNPVTNMVYVTNVGSNSVTAIDGSNHMTQINTGATQFGIAVNTVTNKIYAGMPGGNQIAVIDGSSQNVTMLNGGTGPDAIGVDPVTNRTYVVNRNSNNVTVVDGATNNTASVLTDAGPVAVAVNPATNKIYVANYAGNDVTVIDGATNATVSVPDPNGPISIDVNPVTNKIWVANQNSTVTVIDGATNTSATISVVAPGNITVNSVSNKIYVVSSFGAVTVIDGATNSTVLVNGGNTPVGSAVNPITNKLYVADCPCDPNPPLSSTLTIIDGASNAVSTIPVGLPQAIAINPVTNKIYLTNTNNTMTVVDGFSYLTNTVFVGPNPGAIAVNPITNRIYIANAVAGSSFVGVIDGATNNFAAVPVASMPQAIAVNPVTNKIYVASANNIVTVIDGISNNPSPLLTDLGPQSLAVNLATGRIYVANNGGNDTTVITEQQVNQIPLTTAITALPGNQTTMTQPTFTFTTNSTYAPTAPPVQTVYYQVDTWQGPWLQAAGSAPNFTGQTPVLRLGTHVLYAYAADGQTADSLQTNAQSSPVIGQLAAYVFTVMPSASYAASTLSSSVNPSSFNQSVTFTATVASSTGGTPTGTVSFFDGSRSLATSPLNGGVATFTTATLTPGTHPITVIYSGDSSFLPSLSNAVYQVVRRDPTLTTVALTAGTNPSVAGTAVTFTATVTPEFPAASVPSGNVQFRDGGANLGAPCALIGGACSLTTAALGPGPHAITASYAGDPTFGPSVSAIFTQVVESNAAGGSTAALMANGSAGPVTVNFGVALGALPAQAANFVVTVTGGANGDMVVLMDGTRQLGPNLFLAAGTARYTTQLSVGQHNVQAIYIGSGAAHGSSSLVVTVERSPRPRPR